MFFNFTRSIIYLKWLLGARWVRRIVSLRVVYKDVHFYQDCGQEHALVLANNTQANKYASWTKGMESNVCPHDFTFSLGTDTVYSDRGRVGN